MESIAFVLWLIGWPATQVWMTERKDFKRSVTGNIGSAVVWLLVGTLIYIKM